MYVGLYNMYVRLLNNVDYKPQEVRESSEKMIKNVKNNMNEETRNIRTNLADDDKVAARNTKENGMTKSSTGKNKETRFPFVKSAKKLRYTNSSFTRLSL